MTDLKQRLRDYGTSNHVLDEAADRIESAVRAVLAQGLRTADIWSEGTQKVGTREMGDAVVAAIAMTKTIKG